MEHGDIIALMVRILEIAVRCMEFEEMPDGERRALKNAARQPLLDNVWRMMLHGGLIEVDMNNCPRITPEGLEWLVRHDPEDGKVSD